MAALDFEALKDRKIATALATSVDYKPATEEAETLKICSAFVDDISEVDKNPDTDYPLYLEKPPDSSQPLAHDPHEVFTVVFFIFFVEDGADATERMKLWNKARALGKQFLEDLQKSAPTGDAQDIRITGPIDMINGIHKVHSDQLIGTQFTVPLRVFTGECIEI